MAGCKLEEAQKRRDHREQFTTYVALVIGNALGTSPHIGKTTSGSALIGVDFEGVRYNVTITRERNQ